MEPVTVFTGYVFVLLFAAVIGYIDRFPLDSEDWEGYND